MADLGIRSVFNRGAIFQAKSQARCARHFRGQLQSAGLSLPGCVNAAGLALRGHGARAPPWPKTLNKNVSMKARASLRRPHTND